MALENIFVKNKKQAKKCKTDCFLMQMLLITCTQKSISTPVSTLREWSYRTKYTYFCQVQQAHVSFSEYVSECFAEMASILAERLQLNDKSQTILIIHLKRKPTSWHPASENNSFAQVDYQVYPLIVWLVDPLLVTTSLAEWLKRPPREQKIQGSNPAGDGILPGRVIPVTYTLALQWVPC